MITKTRNIPDGKQKLKNLPIYHYLDVKKLFFPLTSGRCPEGESYVKQGQKVYVGEKIGLRKASFFEQPIHSTVSGTVVGIERHTDASGKAVECVVVENDQAYTLHSTVKERSDEDIDKLSRAELVEIAKEQALVGLGGSGFPTYIKLNSKDPIHVVIANGVECEPFLVSDYQLMMEKPEEIVQGMIYAMKATGAPKGVITIKKKYKHLEEHLNEAIKRFPGHDIIVKPIGNYYPQGWELEVIKNAVGIHIPQGQLLSKYGVANLNVATLASYYQAVKKRLPVLERYFTISGDGAINQSFNVRIGTKMTDLLELSGGYLETEKPKVMIVGGPMMGTNASTDDLVLTHTTTSLIVLNEEIRKEEPCIHCAACVYSCPVSIQPVQIMNATKLEDKETLNDLQVSKCIECGLCSFVCPSKIHLTDYMRLGKRLAK